MNSYFEADSETRQKFMMFAKGYAHGANLLEPIFDCNFYKDGYAKGIEEYFESKGLIQE